ncbi:MULTISPECIES: GDP-L-fucose synthase family protein [unclassified Burkholderia]|uniref:GDP-L-fucose synthase family protein n=1 Tax=unclassified Burkholderia TaxID=2613784 RepID=UPI0005CF7295|nr:MULTISPECIES: GDP-L-fucose synthase [unclassified Burkholderia]TGN94709.1 GDP-L-fucose synthase [Burkholderia sp. USMB20]
MNKKLGVFVAGHHGMVGSAIVRALKESGYENIITRCRKDLDLICQSQVESFFNSQSIDVVLLAAAKVGGIKANDSYPADFLYENLMIEANVIHSAFRAGVKRLIFLGSSCIYPRDCDQPIKEEYLLGGHLEKTNEPYAIAKIAGVKLCESYNRQYGTKYVSLMPTNLYGPNDNYDLNTSHVLPALLRKAHEAKMAGTDVLEVWGSGSARREFLYVDDLAAAAIFLMENGVENGIYNVGCGEDITIGQLASSIMRAIEWNGNIVFDKTKPDGTPRKLLDVSRLANMGWRAKVSLEDGLKMTYSAFMKS